MCVSLAATQAISHANLNGSRPAHLIAPFSATMIDSYGSHLPPILHTRPPTCLPAPVPPLTALTAQELINILWPSFLFLMILPWLIVHLPRQERLPPPKPQSGYVIHAWGGETVPIFWTTPQMPQPQLDEAPKTPPIGVKRE